ncbi:metallophosphoesterase [Dactylosporangium aurantiacum]|uniref:Metallophosphoesterase n=1 Tax=Dactylosporangium aurantiacum TaxID=35754 RepID=A0A9Q9MQ19_9ACTN|nr:metallophosphoesterase [Dactylosporangium aurantiacum]MDG6105521.1 metallophosphoesterase [Dactylosporangium aurantiacum]UWZ57132.1 metallophosphoesterase [Dactylosporangium aurantiacum]
MLIAHLSDLHIGAAAPDRLDRVVTYLATLRRAPDVILVTGDVADHGRAEEYAELGKLRQLGVPVLALPGNHDERAALRAELLDERPASEPVNRVETVAGVVFALCDSSVPGHAEGWLDDGTLEWLDTTLAAAAGAPAFVCCHHPPVPVGKPAADQVRQLGAGRLAEVLGRHRDVLAVLCGHVHSAAVSVFAGVPVLAAPGVESTMVLPWEPEDRPEPPPALAFHLLEEGRLTTHYRLCV